MNYLVFDAIDGEYVERDSFESAMSYIEDSIYDDDGGYHPDAEECKIYKLCEEVVVFKKNGKWKHKFNSLK